MFRKALSMCPINFVFMSCNVKKQESPGYYSACSIMQKPQGATLIQVFVLEIKLIAQCVHIFEIGNGNQIKNISVNLNFINLFQAFDFNPARTKHSNYSFSSFIQEFILEFVVAKMVVSRLYELLVSKDLFCRLKLDVYTLRKII